MILKCACLRRVIAGPPAQVLVPLLLAGSGRGWLGLLYERGDKADHYRNVTFALLPPF